MAVRQAPSIDAWGGGGFRVSGLWRPGSLLILDDQASDWAPATLDAVTMDRLSQVIALAAVAEFVLLGTGVKAALPSRELRDGLKAAGIGLEFMSTEAASRVYNVLASEGRRMAAALIAV